MEKDTTMVFGSKIIKIKDICRVQNDKTDSKKIRLFLKDQTVFEYHCKDVKELQQIFHEMAKKAYPIFC